MVKECYFKKLTSVQGIFQSSEGSRRQSKFIASNAVGIDTKLSVMKPKALCTEVPRVVLPGSKSCRCCSLTCARVAAQPWCVSATALAKWSWWALLPHTVVKFGWGAPFRTANLLALAKSEARAKVNTPHTSTLPHSSLPALWVWRSSDFSQSLLLCAWSVVSDSLRPRGLQPARLLCPWDSGKNTGVGCHALLQGTFPTQGSNPGLPPCGQILYQLSHQGSPWILEWVACHFSRGSSQTRNRTCVSSIAGRFLTNWATRDTLSSEPMGSC